MLGVKTVLRLDGEAAAFLEVGNGRPVLFIHGAGGRGELWRPQLSGLGRFGRLVAVDLPGHGASGGGGRVRVEEYAAWLLRLLDALRLDRAVLVGHSMGGGIAQTMALDHPDRVAGLVLVGTGARLRVLPRLLELLREQPLLAGQLIGSLAYSPATPSAAVAEADRALRETPVRVTLGDFLACDRFNVMDRLGAVRVPALVVVGRDDRLTPPKYASFLVTNIPGARLLEVPDAGHFPQLEQPGAVNETLAAFLADLG